MGNVLNGTAFPVGPQGTRLLGQTQPGGFLQKLGNENTTFTPALAKNTDFVNQLEPNIRADTDFTNWVNQQILDKTSVATAKATTAAANAQSSFDNWLADNYIPNKAEVDKLNSDFKLFTGTTYPTERGAMQADIDSNTTNYNTLNTNYNTLTGNYNTLNNNFNTFTKTTYVNDKKTIDDLIDKNYNTLNTNYNTLDNRYPVTWKNSADTAIGRAQAFNDLSLTKDWKSGVDTLTGLNMNSAWKTGVDTAVGRAQAFNDLGLTKDWKSGVDTNYNTLNTNYNTLNTNYNTLNTNYETLDNRYPVTWKTGVDTAVGRAQAFNDLDLTKDWKSGVDTLTGLNMNSAWKTSADTAIERAQAFNNLGLTKDWKSGVDALTGLNMNSAWKTSADSAIANLNNVNGIQINKGFQIQGATQQWKLEEDNTGRLCLTIGSNPIACIQSDGDLVLPSAPIAPVPVGLPTTS